MNKAYSWYAFITVIVGIYLVIFPFSSLVPGWLQNSTSLVIGLLIYLISLLLSYIAIKKKEQGILKYIPIFSLILVIGFFIYFISIMGNI